MSACTKALLALAVIGLSLPVSAQTPATTALDGRYLGVTNGVVRTPGKGWWEGTVGPQGVIVMHNPNSLRVDAQIDAQGTIRGQYSGPSCINTYVWRKQSG